MADSTAAAIDDAVRHALERGFKQLDVVLSTYQIDPGDEAFENHVSYWFGYENYLLYIDWIAGLA